MLAVAVPAFGQKAATAAAVASPPATPPATAPARPKRVLLLESFGRGFAPFGLFAGEFRTHLAEISRDPIDFYDVSLESARFADGAQDGPFVDYLRALFAERPLDLVVPLGGPAVRFVQRNRARLFPSTPTLIAATDQRHLNELALTENDTVVSVSFDLRAIVENILRVRPDTTRVAVVFGNSPLEKFWVAQTQRDLESFTARVHFDWLNELSLEDMRRKVSALPAHSAILYGQLTVDAAGVPHEEEKALAALLAVANAPMFGVHDYQLGKGIVGGPLMPTSEMGGRTAAVAARLLGGEKPATIKTPPTLAATPGFDWRALRKWNIPESNLPPGSVVRFREPTFWEMYRWHIFALAALCCGEAALIVVLLASRARRRRAERSLRESERRFRTVADAAPVLIWMSGLDKRCLFFNKPWLDFTGRALEQELGDGWAEGVHPDDLAGCLKEYTEAFDARRPFEMSYRLRRADGEYRWVSDHGIARQDDDGRFAGYVGSCVDVTESRERQAALADNEARLRAILDTAVEGIITFERDGTVESANANAQAMFGCTAEELIGRDVKSLILSPLTAGDDNSDGNGASAAAAQGAEAVGIRKDKSGFPIELTVSRITLAGRPLVVGLVRDVTERKEAERYARDLSGRLIKAQEHERSRLARELHDDVTQRLARLAIDVAHIEKSGSPTPQELRAVQKSLVRLSEDVHAVAYQLHPSVLEDLGLEAAIKTECDHFARRESIVADVKVRDVPDGLSRETAICLFRITQEALRNVVRHARAQAVQVTLAGIDSGLQLAVRDDGIGFDPAMRRSRPSLGLASMSERARLIGGELDVESTPGHGTTVLAWVPLKGLSSS